QLDAIYQNAIADSKAMLSKSPTTFNDLKKQKSLVSIKLSSVNVNDISESPSTKFMYDKYYIAERNRGWVSQLPEILAKERLAFYAIGARHFADGSHGAGLITLLREAGYTVSLVENVSTVNAALARLPKPSLPLLEKTNLPMVAHTISGACTQKSGDPYGCSWANDDMSYIVMELPQNMETWVFCRTKKSAYGPANRCTSAIREISAERLHDLALSGVKYTPSSFP
ncbi:MAG: TraB/GumN family protein, partial [Burkholderiales bacterium]|nr:TraB/GumN family protein [Burkholderiales bacterium]